MKIRHLAFTAIIAAAAVGCNNFEDPDYGAANGVLKATVESNGTRVGFDDNGTFYWSENDMIGVTASAEKNGFVSFSITQGAGSGTGSFAGEVEGTIDEGYAVYPYNENHKIEGSTLSYCFPADYAYDKVDADFFSAEQGKGNSFNPAMWGHINNNAVTFKHLGGVFCVKIVGLPQDDNLKFVFSADKKINGSYDVTLSGSEATPSITAVQSSDSNDNEVTIEFSNSASDASGVFYVPVPTGTFGDVHVKVLDGTDKEIFDKSCGEYVIGRRDLRKLEIDATQEDEREDVGSAGDVSSKLESSSAVAVTGEVSGSNEVTVPKAQDEETPVSVSFEKIASGASLKFTDNAQEGETSVKNLTVAIPNYESEEHEHVKAEINMPSSTVTLSSNAGKAHYGEVTAATAANTLIVDGGVTVEKIIVKQGNVRVMSGAEVKAFEKHAENEVPTVYVYVEAGAKLPSSLPESFVEIDSDLADLKEAAAYGGKYVLKSDMAFPEPLVVTGEMTLDLNGHSITAADETLNKVLNTSDALILVRRGAKLIIDDSSNGNGRVDTGEKEAIYAAVKLTDAADGASGDAATLVVNGGVLKGYYYGIAGNGTRHTTNVTVADGKIEAYKITGIYHPQNGSLTVNGGEISGPDTGIEMRSGKLNVSGGRIVSTATELKVEANGSGTTISGAAVAVSQHATDLELNVDITNGVLEGVYAIYEKDLQNETGRDKIGMSVKGGDIKGSVYSYNCKSFVSGGTFSDPSALGYLVENANVKVALNKDYTGPGVGIYYNGNGKKSTVEIDLNNHKWTVTDEPLHGSSGTVSQYFHLEKDAVFTVKNGTIEPQNSTSGLMLFQNYCKLTLQKVALTAGSACQYVISNNNGSCDIIDSTITASQGNCAFDVYSFSSYEGVTVTVSGDSKINGRVEFGGDNDKKNIKLVVNGGTFEGDLKVTEKYYDTENPNIILNNGTFNGNGWDTYKNK